MIVMQPCMNMKLPCAYQQLGVGGVEYPPNGIKNALTRQLANDLP